MVSILDYYGPNGPKGPVSIPNQNQPKPLTGPILPGATRPTVTPPVSAPTATPIQPTGTLQGPFPLRDANNNITAIKQGMPAIPNSVKQATQDEANRIKALGTSAPVSAGNSYQPPDYAALAAARTALALRQKQTIAQQQKDSADAAYNKQNLRTQDNRTLENGQINRTLSPFAGKTAYDKGLIGRERTQADADSAASLASQKANIDQLLADYQNSTADEQIRIADELKRADQQYQLQLSQLSGQLPGGGLTLAGQQQAYNQNPNNPSNVGQNLNNQNQAIQNQLAQYQLDNYPAEAKAKATILAQQVKSGQMSNEAAEYNLKQLKDPNSAANKAQALDLQMKQLEAKNLPEQQRLQLQQLKKQIAEIGVVHYKPQTANEIEMDKVKLDTAKAELAKLQNASSTPKIDPKESTDNLTFYQEQVDLRPNLTKAQKLSYAQGQKSGLSDSDYNKLVAYINANS